MTNSEKQELDTKMESILKENNLDWQSVHLWIMNQGYVIISQEEYDNLEPKIEIGKVYLTRGGDVEIIVAIDAKNKWQPIIAGSGKYFTRNGIYCIGMTTCYDLIEEYKYQKQKP